MLENVYESLDARPKVYLSKEYYCEMYPTCVSSKLCEFIYSHHEMLRGFTDTVIVLESFQGVPGVSWHLWLSLPPN